MLKRKITDELLAWKQSKTRQGLLITGARQVGKTTAIREFARENYACLLEVNFYDDRRAVETVSQARDARDLFLRLSALGGVEIVPGNTLVFLDEIQECGDLLTWMKFLATNDVCDYIFSGSLLGLDSFDVRSLPVGFLRTLQLFPMDFEEFCWATGIGPSLLEEAASSLVSHTPVPDYLHQILMDAYDKYTLVGGMPDAVATYVSRNDLPAVRKTQSDIFELYEHDVAQYVSDRVEARQIKMVYEAIPGQLNLANKRFKYGRLSKNLRFANLETAFDWLGRAGVALPVTRVTEPVFPLGATAVRSSFKLFMNDVGLLTSQLMRDVDIDILNKRSNINFGSIYENVVAQELRAHGFGLFYFNTAKIGEVDYLLQGRRGDITLCEIKSGKDYQRHSALNNLLGVKNYEFEDAFVFCNDNVSQKGAVTYLPIYLLGFLRP